MSANDPILMVHCFYQRPGGEDTAYRAESALLAARGHAVERMELHNKELEAVPRTKAAVHAIWNPDAARQVEQRVRSSGARVVHFHNTFPLMSPAVYAAAHRAGARVVQTLYNYRLVCPAALMLRDGAPCEDCVGRTFAWPAVRHACYRDSTAASAVVATMLGVHHALGTWSRVDAFIAVSSFLRDRVIRGGLPAARVHVKGPHLSDDFGMGTHGGNFALYVGRLSEEKGIRTLLEAWHRMHEDLPLRIIGDGPLRAEVAEAAAGDSRITFEGHVDAARIAAVMQTAKLLVLPSIWYEGAPLVLAEAAAAGLPVVASGIGGIGECVDDGTTGVLVAPRDAAALVEAVTGLAGDRSRLEAMSASARSRFERTMSADAAYTQLMRIYAHAVEAHDERITHPPGVAGARR